MDMQDYQKQFIEFCLQHDVMKFGEFKLKSGRISPYFFNAGLFNSGEALNQVGSFFAQAINQANLDYDVIFGPAYKGIPLATATAMQLAKLNHNDTPYCFNRKIPKDHGEGGNLVGTPLENKKVLIIDDVITAGTAIRQSMDIIKDNNATAAGVALLMDRQERGKNEHSAIQEVEQEFNLPVISIIKLEDLISYLSQSDEMKQFLPQVEQYRSEYGV